MFFHILTQIGLKHFYQNNHFQMEGLLKSHLQYWNIFLFSCNIDKSKSDKFYVLFLNKGHDLTVRRHLFPPILSVAKRVAERRRAIHYLLLLTTIRHLIALCCKSTYITQNYKQKRVFKVNMETLLPSQWTPLLISQFLIIL